MTDKEIIKGIQDLVKAYPNDQSLGIRIREFINHLDREEDNGMSIQPNFGLGINHVPTIEELQAQDRELRNLIDSYYGRNDK